MHYQFQTAMPGGLAGFISLNLKGSHCKGAGGGRCRRRRNCARFTVELEAPHLCEFSLNPGFTQLWVGEMAGRGSPYVAKVNFKLLGWAETTGVCYHAHHVRLGLKTLTFLLNYICIEHVQTFIFLSLSPQIIQYNNYLQCIKYYK
jgi:hypothetical protein